MLCNLINNSLHLIVDVPQVEALKVHVDFPAIQINNLLRDYQCVVKKKTIINYLNIQLYYKSLDVQLPCNQ